MPKLLPAGEGDGRWIVVPDDMPEEEPTDFELVLEDTVEAEKKPGIIIIPGGI